MPQEQRKRHLYDLRQSRINLENNFTPKRWIISRSFRSSLNSFWILLYYIQDFSSSAEGLWLFNIHVTSSVSCFEKFPSCFKSKQSNMVQCIIRLKNSCKRYRWKDNWFLSFLFINNVNPKICICRKYVFLQICSPCECRVRRGG